MLLGSLVRNPGHVATYVFHACRDRLLREIMFQKHIKTQRYNIAYNARYARRYEYRLKNFCARFVACSVAWTYANIALSYTTIYLYEVIYLYL